jgi:transposase
MKGIPQGRYTKEFRQEAVKLVMEEGLSWGEAARRLSLALSTLGYWMKAFKTGKLGEIGKTQRPLTEIEMELARTKKELVIVKMERDILKKQPRTLPGSRCPVRDDKGTAAQVSYPADATNYECIGQRVLCLAGPVAVEASPGGRAAGGGD